LLLPRVIGHRLVVADGLEGIVGFPQAAGIRFILDHLTSWRLGRLRPRKVATGHELSAHTRVRLPLLGILKDIRELRRRINSPDFSGSGLFKKASSDIERLFARADE
jgi:hypothetical protein